MSTEIERKFVVGSMPPSAVLGRGVALRQGYLAEEGDVEVRLRLTADSATLTVKAGRGVSRQELELDVEPTAAEALWPYTEGRRIEKTRSRVELDGVTAEVDVYAGALVGLAVVEVEFDSEAAAAAFRPPDWFGVEVTGQPDWSNAALARRGQLPEDGTQGIEA